MPNTYFQFKQFTVHHDRCAMKVTTDSCLFGAWVAAEMQKSKATIENVLDVGCGTGLLSLMLAQATDAAVDAIEINSDAAEQAKENVAGSAWKERIYVINADVLQWVPTKKYDSIVSNPPFYESELKSGKAAKNIAHHDEGLKLKELFRFIKNHLTADGVFYLLLPEKRKALFETLLERYHFYAHKTVWVKQSLKHDPFRLMIKAGNSKSEPHVEQLAIKSSNNGYTPEFTQLLKNYYLHL